MFSSVFTKTIYEKRWMMLFWSIGVIGMALLMMAFYHSFSGGGFDELLKNLPKSFQGLVGNLNELKTVGGYVSQEVFALRIPLLTLIMGIVLFTGLIAGDESEGTLQTLLTQPISRLQLLLEKFLAGLFISFVICASAIAGVMLGTALIHEHMNLVRLFQAVVGVWLLTVACGSIGFMFGAITGKKGLAGSVAGLLTFSFYMITSFAGSVSWLARPEKLSLFHYYNNPGIALYGLKGSNVIVMVGIIAILLVVSAVVFQKRDIYQR
ncbi:MAG TPA: ABC transporter permease subunit [Candidatus Saccharimonadales bacterium]|nr:ABC transporter permease subunit [Candidatus Saccharimonadales bacterium]